MIRPLSTLAALILLPATALATPTAVPYGEDFTSSTTTCDAPFSTTSCPAGWEGRGDNDTIEYVNGNGDAGLRITPGSTTPNGVSQVFEADPADGYLQHKVLAWTSGGGTATLMVRLVFKNSSGVTVSTSTYSYTASWSTTLRPFVDNTAIPSTAATAELLIGAVNPSTSSTIVELPGTFEVETQTAPWIILWPTPIDEECEEQTCTPDISCPEGEEPLCVCDAGEPPLCVGMKECSCIEGPAETLAN